MAKDYQLKGKNFCGLSCVDQESVIHPETCIQNTLISCEYNEPQSLQDWLLGDSSEERELKGSLYEWLYTYWSGDVAFHLEVASNNVLGGIRVGQYLSIVSDPNSLDYGKLSVDKSSLGIPTEFVLNPASHKDEYELGGVNIFNEWKGKKERESEYGIDIYGGTVNFDVGDIDPFPVTLVNPIEYVPNTTIPSEGSYYLFPVDIIKGKKTLEENCLIVTVPWQMFNQSVVHYDIVQNLTAEQKAQARTNIGAGTSSFSGSYNDLTNKPSLANVATSGNYNDLFNKPAIPVTENARVINAPIYNDGVWSWDEISTITNITYTGNAVVNLGIVSDGEDIINTAEGALSILLSADCKYNHITLYILQCTADNIQLGEGITINCFRNTNNFAYTINDDKYNFAFGDDVTRIDLFKDTDTNIITFYVNGYTKYTGEA